ncbi:DUF2267 domain-containing protein [Streptomyces sp. FXJ1.172]|uniref:DUF2267 domain-containing protein n=1 Tax=Streptomyces sp. FXJ1.172 TaxID=710705 RepID=UPI0007D026C8|nr:DUF2267 domain-containing protein [Streptomyces sp. FXJ1.172]WEO93040.1 DUF2267 domain-containing protein [Streptomyces sp. FXJ1.172]
MHQPVEVLLDRVSERGAYADQDEAARAVRSVLSVLGSHLVGDDRTDLATLLPSQCVPWLTQSAPASEPLTPSGFVEAVAERDIADEIQARRAVAAVLSTLADMADEALLRRILTQLPPGHAALFDRVDPA